jgi:hypothetical protein
VVCTDLAVLLIALIGSPQTGAPIQSIRLWEGVLAEIPHL